MNIRNIPMYIWHVVVSLVCVAVCSAQRIRSEHSDLCTRRYSC